MASGQKHENYEALNLIGYGLSKFNEDFVRLYGFESKMALYRYCMSIGMMNSINVIKTRQDEFDSVMPESPRAGWHNADGSIRQDYQNRKDYIDSFYGNLGVEDYVAVVKMTVAKKFGERVAEQKLLGLQPTLSIAELSKGENEVKTKPIIQSCFRQMQITGYTAECYFLRHYKKISDFANAAIEDARLFGDGYDFQMTLPTQLYLAEVKGMRETSGQLRMTQNEYEKAEEYGKDYALVIVANLQDAPVFKTIFNPLNELKLTLDKTQPKPTVFYRSEMIAVETQKTKG
ncbi:MAG: DUF3883 domain-containing protein [Planctomycetaceae bacterium]|jgi:hypothetical protein|nr:DUF3883 domain-containing protein [Planctomycetaceae bacterium]